jgi:uncharacterized protein YjiS (DUF1127 family)
MSILNLLISAGRAFAERGRRQRAYQELMALDDHALTDIGIHRSQVCALLEGAELGKSAPAPAAEAANFWSAQIRLISSSNQPDL